MTTTALRVVPRVKIGHRPRKLASPEQRERILGHLRTGVPRIHASQAVGCTDETLRAEMARDLAFSRAVETAESEAVAVAIGVIQGAASSGQWQAAAWFLERRYPQQYARRFVADAAPGTTMKFTLDITGGNAEQGEIVEAD